MASKLFIVMYHYVRDLHNNRYSKIKGLDYTLFKQQLEFFNENFNVVTMEEVIASYKESYILPKNAILLTFDDGYIDNYTYVMPTLLEYGMQGSFFIPGKTFTEYSLLDVNKIHFLLATTSITILLQDLFDKMNYYRGQEFNYPLNDELFAEYAIANRFDSKETIFFKRILQVVLPEKLRSKISSEMFETHVGIKEETFARELYLNYDQMKCMKRNGMFFGIHGYDHYWLGNLEKQQMEKDIMKAINVMGDFIAKDSWVMNYPYGSYNEDVLNFIGNNGCKVGLTTQNNIADISIDNHLKLPRLDTNDFPPKSNNYTKFGGSTK